MALTIKTTGIEDYVDPSGETFLKALILGPPSAGKTRSASFWPKPIFADCEKGRMSIADRKVPYAEVASTDDMATLIRMLRVECAKPVAQRRFQTFVVDTLDAYQRIVIQERLTSERKEALQGFADWGYLDAKMTQLTSHLLALPMNIVVNVHTKETKDGDDGPLITGVKLKGDIRDQIAAEFDLVGLMGISYEARGGERVQVRTIQWHPEPRVPILKDRSGRLPKHTPVNFTEQDYDGLLEPMRSALEGLTPSEDVDTLQQDPEAAALAVAPTAGGAVSAPAPAPVKKAPAKKAPAKAAPVAPAVPAAAPPVANVPVAKKPGIEVVEAGTGVVDTPDAGPVDEATGEIQDAPSEAEAIQTAVEGLGGTVLDPEAETPMAQQADELQAETEAATPVDTPAPAPAAGGAPDCGAPGRNNTGETAPGCGKSLQDESKDVVNIGLIQTGRKNMPTYLCGACIAAFRAAS